MSMSFAHHQDPSAFLSAPSPGMAGLFPDLDDVELNVDGLVPNVDGDGGGQSLVPDVAGLGIEATSLDLDLDSVISELDALSQAKPKPVSRGGGGHGAACAVSKIKSFPRAPRPTTATVGADDAITRWFPKAVLELEPKEYQRVKKDRLRLLSEEQQRDLTSLRRRVRNCVYAEEKRQRRIQDKREADVSNLTLQAENTSLREENARLRLELAAFGLAAH